MNRKFEVKDTQNQNVKRLIIYDTSSDVDTSYGFKLQKKDLYELYILLREQFKDQ